MHPHRPRQSCHVCSSAFIICLKLLLPASSPPSPLEVLEVTARHKKINLWGNLLQWDYFSPVCFLQNYRTFFFFPPLVFLNVKAEEKADLQTRGSHYTWARGMYSYVSDLVSNHLKMASNSNAWRANQVNKWIFNGALAAGATDPAVHQPNSRWSGLTSWPFYV